MNNAKKTDPTMADNGVPQKPGSSVAPSLQTLLQENIARVEALKIRIIGSEGLSDWDKQTLFGELDTIRGAFIETRSKHQTLGWREVGRGQRLREVLKPDQLVLEGIVGRSGKIQEVLKIISQVANRDLPVLLEGDTGTGKEMFSQVIHLNSQRTKFVAVNCGAFPAGLIESELFGHVRGAFTGAHSERKGKFEEAEGGTLFLDEIGDLELSAQVKLLRVLESGELQRVGSDAVHRINVRLITATNRNLEEMVAAGTFRQDLLYRINVCPITIPPLRDRRDEIPILLDYFFQEITAGNAKAIPVLSEKLAAFLFHHYDFPGNIRELRNLAQYMAAVWLGEILTLENLPQRYQGAALEAEGALQSEANGKPNLLTMRDAAEKEFLIESLQRRRGNIAQVCKETSLSRARVYQLLKKYELKAKDYRRASQ